ncbi:MAG: anaerobic ribonucleoside-triphosphate reductase activating protein [Candidatus Bathyarchaeia archaeon]|jgi:pyruvate formate lyase activating enzyme|nr:anaerobic ribonucleoside-triphosphate reductase activating protein [Candidatus Bathyarchaeota archaeon A05DMB-4]MDH7595919.1 anaerobic ribonucleoside-triphosphate reductase activating protein [Candidatus Bathyarchaeota archaeon]
MDPVPIKGFVDLSLVDWPNRVASVVFLPNCNFRCPNCYNVQLVLRPGEMRAISLEEVLRYLRDRRGWIDGVAITGGEPTLHEGLPGFCEMIKGFGLGVKLDTNGTNPEMVGELIDRGLVDYVAVDLKAPLTVEKYSKAAGVGVDHFLARIEKTIDVLLLGRVDYEFRTTLVPTIHELCDVEQICMRIKGCRRYVLQNFKADVEMINPMLQSQKPFTRAQMQAFKEIALKTVPNTFTRE